MAALSINPTGFKQIFWFEFIHKELYDIIRGRATPSPILFWKTSEKKPVGPASFSARANQIRMSEAEIYNQLLPTLADDVFNACLHVSNRCLHSELAPILGHVYNSTDVAGICNDLAQNIAFNVRKQSTSAFTNSIQSVFLSRQHTLGEGVIGAGAAAAAASAVGSAAAGNIVGVGRRSIIGTGGSMIGGTVLGGVLGGGISGQFIPESGTYNRIEYITVEQNALTRNSGGVGWVSEQRFNIFQFSKPSSKPSSRHSSSSNNNNKPCSTRECCKLRRS